MLKFKDLMERINETRSLYLEEVEQVDEISSDMAHRYLKGKHERDYNTSADGKSSSLKKPQSFRKMNNDVKSSMRALRTIEKSKKANEEVESIDELSEPTVRTYYNKAGEQGKKIADKMKMGGGDWSKDGSDTKTLKKRAAGRTMALKRRSGEVKMSEDAEQTDEALKGSQHKIDANKNGKVDGHDFKILRNAKKARYQ